MGIVYHARELSLDRDVAIKVLPRELSFDRQFRERFKREVKTLPKLRHQNIVTLYSADEAGGFIYFTMEYVDGKTLSGYLEEKKTLEPEEIRNIICQMSAGLEHAHEEGVLHRDLSPENVMIDRKGNVYVMDFGIA
jgi:serine/threonine-protein kinase